MAGRVGVGLALPGFADNGRGKPRPYEKQSRPSRRWNAYLTVCRGNA